MTWNSFGRIFRCTTWGESHGVAIGCVVDGVPSQLSLCEADIQQFLDQRKPAQNKYTTQRKESDKVSILSGVFDGVTTGTPIALMIHNEDQRSKDYGEIAQSFRPGHADYTYHAKYGVRDYRGGGRSSARETAMRVAAGAIARKVLAPYGIIIRACMVQMGEHKIDVARFDWNACSHNPFWCPDSVMAQQWEDYLDGIRKDGSSVGAIIEVHAEHVPVGWGAPIYAKLDADLAAAFMSINAVKAVEIGDGFASAALRGEQNADEMFYTEGKVGFRSNHAGGILGGISTGQTITARFAVKPTSSILTHVESITSAGEAMQLRTKGRHDPCVGIRAVPVAEAMMACVLADHALLARSYGHPIIPTL
ncbi:MAG: chorismate synthase [Alphaproteobacteria bacterium]|nr:MAG: chorismate synthase [Alphaproteobacteria bacterium]TAF15658.1 MAG: chorismate synthase [Alphaproteobacteria bacterium]TAF41095.1 MAG: chorismate synthase [Alphaproteobacteria bacterium]TAF76179.1 MAG: chorismate synthase [Alphaproteobacteria bacterium]